MKKVLIFWPVDRKDLMIPFLQLAGKIEFCIIWDKSKESNVHHPFKEYCFRDFTNPYKILDVIKPDKIIFFDLNSFPEIALNLAAKNSGILTYSMHHGIYMANEIDLALSKEKEKSPNGKWINSFSSLFFYLAAFHVKNFNEILGFLYFPFLRKIKHRMIAVYKLDYEFRKPNYFIQLSSHNAIITKKLNFLSSDKRMLYIGHPFFDNYFSKSSKTFGKSKPYYLLIDFPNIESNIAFKAMGIKGKHEFYMKLSDYAKTNGKRLKVKLHPYGYDSPYNIIDNNVDLVKDVDFMPLLLKSDGCFAFYSSLIVPMCYYKQCYLFDVGLDLPLQEDLAELKMCKLLDAKSFISSEISFNEKQFFVDRELEVFIERYLYKADGEATNRLGKILMG